MRSGRWVGGLALSCVLFLPLPAMAQHEKGDVSLAGAGSLTVQGGENSGVSGTVATTAGVFVAPNIEIGGTALVFLQTTEPKFLGALGGFARQYFGKDKTRPYVGVDGLLVFVPGAAGESSTTLGRGTANVGVRHYISRNSAVFAEGQYGVDFGGGLGTNFDKGLTVVFGFAVIL